MRLERDRETADRFRLRARRSLSTHPARGSRGHALAGRARELERELRMLGPINPLALQSTTPWPSATFLQQQLDDVKAGASCCA